MFRDFQKDLVNAWTDYSAGRIDAKTLKGFSAGFGIYQQRDDKTMMRVRRPGGIVTADDLILAQSLLVKYGFDYAHITTRQAIQLHGIAAKDVTAALSDCEDNGFKFRGGGGDTFRNTLVNADSGLHEDTVFDVLPYARRMSELFYGFDTAYALPRKLKIGFVDRAADAAIAISQDLGFVAKIVNGRRCFETYLAGGIGLKPRLGLKLFDALPAENCMRVAMALTRLFNDKGCRTNRSHARIRFLREDLGDEGLVALFNEYYDKAVDAPLIEEGDLVKEFVPVTSFASGAVAAEGFDIWKELAVKPLSCGRVAVRIFVPFGNFTADELLKFVEVMRKYGAVRLQILPTQDFSLVVPEDQLAGLYNVLVTELGDRDYTVRSFVGHVTTCIGCVVCKSGITDAPTIGRDLALALDKYLPADTPEKMKIAKAVLNDVRISGCPNSCTTQPLAKFGFSGRKADGKDAETPYAPGSSSASPVLGAPDFKTIVTIDDLPEYLVKKILES